MFVIFPFAISCSPVKTTEFKYKSFTKSPNPPLQHPTHPLIHLTTTPPFPQCASQPSSAVPKSDIPIVIRCFILEPHEVLDLGNGVKALDVEIACPNSAHRTKRALELKKRALNYCDASTFNNKSSGGSPKVSVCAVIRDTGYRHIGYSVSGPCWLPGSGPLQGSKCYNPWMWYGTCIFGANSDDTGWTRGEEIGDFVRDSINKFQWNGIVGAEGTAICVWAEYPNDKKVIPTNRSIWHTWDCQFWNSVRSWI
ncbi:hypothetical protein CSAL01_01804 [Colletotrichum salicis]|uniref:Ecp2 effector protein-like domain-containing protein n=1 Tax=Colletotrichum salicis TaxID=1209931 RepID=A0A135T6V7_9PEZI|nr:hypothetical protein CSAL01_01804 [Colletotrichum salicis]